MSEDFLSRWSRLKRTGGDSAAKQAPVAEEAMPRVVPAANTAAPPAPPPLPPIESLEPGADIAQFMQASVDESLKRQALKKLLQDPRFNVMDGLDVYIDDYSQPDPLPEGWLEKMNQTARLGDYHEPEPAEEPLDEEAAQPAETLPEPDAQEPGAAPPLDTPDDAMPPSQGTQ
jgi:hypothetical protein